MSVVCVRMCECAYMNVCVWEHVCAYMFLKLNQITLKTFFYLIQDDGIKVERMEGKEEVGRPGGQGTAEV